MPSKPRQTKPRRAANKTTKTENGPTRRPQAATQRLAVLWRERDYAALLAQPLPPAIGVLVDGKPLHEAALELVRECPRETQAQHPIGMLRLAYVQYSANNREDADELMQTIRADIEALPGKKEQKTLLGEWTFITALSHYPHIEKMLEAMEQVDELLSGGRVTMLDESHPFLYMLTSPFAVFHTVPGKAEEQGAAFARFAALYEKLTGGGGRGAAPLYDAGLCYYRGDFAGAKLLCYKTAYLADTMRQAFLQMGAARLLAFVAIHEMDMDAFTQALEMQQRAAALRPEYGGVMQTVLEFERSELYFEVSVTEHTPQWIQNGMDVPVAAFSRAFIKLQQMRYFYYSQKDEQCIGLGEALLYEQQGFSVLVKAIIGMYVAVAYLRLGHVEQGMALFTSSFPAMFPDKLYLVFSYFYENMNGALADVLRKEYPDDIEAIFRQMKQNRQGRLCFMRTYLDAANALTEKERAVAQLAAQGLQNKEIAKKLGTSVNTVRTHLRRVFEKLEIDRRSEITKRLI